MEASDQYDQPVTPTGRLFLRPELHQIINIAMGFKHPLNIEAIKTEFSNSNLVQHPRFTSLLVINKTGKMFWRKTQINFDDHFIIHNESTTSELENQEQVVNDYLADFAVSCPLSMEKPLWEIHVMSGLKCLILRFHHALGDGISMVSLFLDICKRINDNGDENSKGKRGRIKDEKRKEFGGIMKMIWNTTVSVMELLGRSTCITDKTTVISGGAGVEHWPRMVATACFSLEDMKIVKRAIPNATINDVLFGVVSCGLSRYLEAHSNQVLKENLQITGAVMVNLRKQIKFEEKSKLVKEGSKSGWGNRVGIILVPIYYQSEVIADPLKYVKRAKAMIDKKKNSLEAHFSYYIGKMVMSCFGLKAASKLNYRIICNTTFVISNVVGAEEELALASNPISYFRVITSSVPQALQMTMLSYAGKAEMQISVAKDIIPDPHFLAKCFEDALLQMKIIAMQQ